MYSLFGRFNKKTPEYKMIKHRTPLGVWSGVCGPCEPRGLVTWSPLQRPPWVTRGPAHAAPVIIITQETCSWSRNR